MSSGVVFRGVTKSFGGVVAVRNVNLEIPQGKLVALLGPSGCGKSTSLRLIAGLEQPNSGSILIGGQDVAGTPSYRRNVGMVFQSYALFPHLSVFENIAFGLRMRRVGKREAQARVGAAMRLVQLDALADRLPAALSGGQQQRVALARAVVTEPAVLLLDEPLAALDKRLRAQVQEEIVRIQRVLGITTVFVTHDQEEALNVADLIAIMRDGGVEQFGPPLEIYERPRTRFVSEFVGLSNILSAHIVSAENNEAVVRLSTGDLVRCRVDPVLSAARQTPVQLLVRPEKIRLDQEAPEGVPRVAGTIARATYLGEVTRYYLTYGDAPPLVVTEQNRTGSLRWRVGDRVYAYWSIDGAVLSIPPAPREPTFRSESAPHYAPPP